jgi:hypothetical protein
MVACPAVLADGCVLLCILPWRRHHVAHADAARVRTQVRSMYTQVKALSQRLGLFGPLTRVAWLCAPHHAGPQSPPVVRRSTTSRRQRPVTRSSTTSR